MEDDDEEPGVQKDSFERLSPSDSEEPRPGATPCERVAQEDWENNEEDILMGDDQVADFASSMLAAISCWHYRAKALLFARFTTVRLSATNGLFTPPFVLPTTPT